MAKRTRLAEMNCSLARALDVVGEWWTLLVIREVYFGRRRFTEMQRTLGVAKNILSDRLSTLVTAAVLERRPVAGDQRQIEYHLTEKGVELLPVLVMLMDWGDRWENRGNGVPVVLADADTGAPIEPKLVDAVTGNPIEVTKLRVRRGPGFDPEAWPRQH